jgi:N-acetylglucosaminyldiphosphoundecaprenol N-acetyl-beta-D-mannosaminyltransferase
MTAGVDGAESGNPAEGVRKRIILGVPFAMVDYDETMNFMDAMIADRRRGYVCAAAVHVTMVAQEDEETRRALLGATLVLPDGMPIVWAANLLGEALRDRVYGPELMRRFNARSARAGHRIWLMGGRDEQWLQELMRRMRVEHPDILIAGGHRRPAEPLTSVQEDRLVEQINAARPDVIWVGLGAPAQEKWMARMGTRLEVPLMCGVGQAFDLLAGCKAEAPPWMQRNGLEWLFRMAQEPRRLAPRYAYYNPRYISAVMRQIWHERRV